MRNLRIKVVENCFGNYWAVSLYLGNKRLLTSWGYEHKKSAIRAAKRVAGQAGIKYDPEIIKLHGC